MLAFILSSILLSQVSAKSDYKVVNINRSSSYIQLTLAYIGTLEYYIKPTSPIIKNLSFLFQTYTYNDFIVKITDSNSSRFEIPQGGAFPADPSSNFSFPTDYAAVLF